MAKRSHENIGEEENFEEIPPGPSQEQQSREKREYEKLREMLPRLSSSEDSVSQTDIVEEAASYIGQLHDRVRETFSHPDDILRAKEFLTQRMSQDLQRRKRNQTSEESHLLTSDLQHESRSKMGSGSGVVPRSPENDGSLQTDVCMSGTSDASGLVHPPD